MQLMRLMYDRNNLLNDSYEKDGSKDDSIYDGFQSFIYEMNLI